MIGGTFCKAQRAPHGLGCSQRSVACRRGDVVQRHGNCYIGHLLSGNMDNNMSSLMGRYRFLMSIPSNTCVRASEPTCLPARTATHFISCLGLPSRLVAACRVQAARRGLPDYVLLCCTRSRP